MNQWAAGILGTLVGAGLLGVLAPWVHRWRRTPPSEVSLASITPEVLARMAGALAEATSPEMSPEPEDDDGWRRELRYRGVRAIKALPEQQMVVVTLYLYEDFTLAEIALMLRLDLATVERLYAEAMEVIARVLIFGDGD